MQKRNIYTLIFLLFLFSVTLTAFCTFSVSAAPPSDDVELSLTVDRRLTAGSGKELGGTYYISADSTFSQSYTVANQSSSNMPLDIVLQERVLSESGTVISDWINLPATVAKGASATLNGTNLVMTDAYGKKITFQYRLRYKSFVGSVEYASHTADIFVYAPTFSANYTTDASPVALSDFPIYFGGKITLTSSANVGEVSLYDSAHGLIEAIGDMTPNTTKRFQKDFFLPAGSVDSYLIVEYTDLLTGKRVKTELTDVKITGNIIDAPIETKLSLQALPAKTFIQSDETIEIIFELKNDLSYDILSSYVYLLDQDGKASAEPIFDFGPVVRGQSVSVKKNIALQPNIKYSYAVYAYVPNSSTPLKASYDFVTTSVPPSLDISRSIEGEKLPFYQEATINYVVKNISSKEVHNVVIADSILGEIHKADSIKAGDEITFSVKHKFTTDFVSNPIVNLVINDEAQTKNTFMIERQVFEVMKKDKPSIAIFIENIAAKDRKAVSFDVILANDGNAALQQIELIDLRDNSVAGTLDLLRIGEKQSIYLAKQDYSEHSEVLFRIKALTDRGEELTFDMEPVRLPSSFRAALLIVMISVGVLAAAAVIYFKKRQNKTK